MGLDIPATPQELSSGIVETLPVDLLLQIKADGAVPSYAIGHTMYRDLGQQCKSWEGS